MFKNPFSNRKPNELTDVNLNALRTDDTIVRESSINPSISDDDISSITTDNDDPMSLDQSSASASTNIPPIPSASTKAPPIPSASTNTPVKGAGKVKCVRKENDGTLKIVKCNTLTDIEERDEVTNAEAELAKAETAHKTAAEELSKANAELATAQTAFNTAKSKVSRLDKITNNITNDKFASQRTTVNIAKNAVNKKKTAFDIATKRLKTAEKRLENAKKSLTEKQKILENPGKWCLRSAAKTKKGGGKSVSRKHRTRTFSKSRKLRGRRSVGKSSSRKIRK
jgi:hypothetical protein